MSNDLASLYAKEVEDSISLVKTQHIPAQDWKGADVLLRQCEQTLVLLEKEARTGGKRESIMAVVVGLRREIDALNQETKKKVLFSRNRRGSSGEDPEKGGLLEEAEEKKVLGKSKLALKKSLGTVQIMTDQGTEIQRQMDEQEQTMKSAMGKMNKTDQMGQIGRRHLNEIERGELRNKIFMYGAVIIVFIGIVVMLYYVFFRA